MGTSTSKYQVNLILWPGYYCHGIIYTKNYTIITILYVYKDTLIVCL